MEKKNKKSGNIGTKKGFLFSFKKKKKKKINPGSNSSKLT